MEKMVVHLFLVLSLMAVSACSGKFLKSDIEKIEKKKQLLDQVLVIEPIPVEETIVANATPTPAPVVVKPSPTPKAQSKTTPKAKNKVAVKPTPEPTPARRLPLIEDDAGFQGRRPLIDPFRIGEKVLLDVSYLGVNAGVMTIEIPHYVNVNGRKAYRMINRIKSNTAFSTVYEVDDWAEALMDFEHMAPSMYALHVRETGQMREAKALFDMLGGKAQFTETKISKKKGTEEKNQLWDIPAYSQNVFTAAFYMRLFQWQVGKEIQFPVAHDNENIIFKGTAVRKEVISTDAGDFNTIVIKPEFQVKGVFKPVGDIYFWLTDDEQKLIVKIEAKIKIGTLVLEADEVHRGR